MRHTWNLPFLGQNLKSPVPLTKTLVTQSVPDLCTALLASSHPPPAAVHPSASCPSGAASWLPPASLCNDRAAFGDVEALYPPPALGFLLMKLAPRTPVLKVLLNLTDEF